MIWLAQGCESWNQAALSDPTFGKSHIKRQLWSPWPHCPQDKHPPMYQPVQREADHHCPTPGPLVCKGWAWRAVPLGPQDTALSAGQVLATLKKAADSQTLKPVISTPRCLPCPGPNHRPDVPVKNKTLKAQWLSRQQGNMTLSLRSPRSPGAQPVNPFRFSNTRLVKNPCTF